MRPLQGILTALITPFDGDSVDVPALRRLVRAQVAAGIHGLVACGTTGETPTLTADECDLVLKTVMEEVAGRIPVLAGTGTNATRTTVDRTRRAAALGADAALVVTPYYNKPQQEGMVEHFRAVAREGGIPLVLYTVPGRTGVNLLPETVVRLSAVPGILGIKEASGSVAAVRTIVDGAAPGFVVLSGDDGLALPSFAVGARGVISVASNVVPARMVELWDSWESGDTARAARIDRDLGPLYSALFLESSPAPVKAAARMLGICAPSVRPPLAVASPATVASLELALRRAGGLPEDVRPAGRG
jgi:4-hydroxy-tetrahydrodipicolinate synthase